MISLNSTPKKKNRLPANFKPEANQRINNLLKRRCIWVNAN